jgi:four helix bundle protein
MPEKTGSYKDLLVWQQSMDLAAEVYSVTKAWPRDEIYGLTSQVRRAAVSVPANIAEDMGANSAVLNLQSLRIAQGSLKELETHLMIAERVGISPSTAIGPLIATSESVGKLLRLLLRKLSSG